MVEIAFVVLHYMAVEDTCECVDSIMNLIDIDNYQIIIVDNASPDDSLNFLHKKYDQIKKISIIHSNENLGFAKGNNLGYCYAKSNLNANFIVLLNNDICLFQKNFYMNLKEIYAETPFAVMGPMIITKDGRCGSNPKGNHVLSKAEVLKKIKQQSRRNFLNKIYIDGVIYDVVLKALKSVKNAFIKKKNTIDYSRPVLNAKLHGSFLIFSKDYIKEFDGLDSSTFMYFEEDILYLHMMYNHMQTLYHPGIAVYHKEDASTDLSIGNGRKKKLFTTWNNIKSMEIYLSLLDKYKNN